MNNKEEKHKAEVKLLKEVCREQPNEYYLIKELLEIQRKKSLMLRKWGIKDELNNAIDTFIKKGHV